MISLTLDAALSPAWLVVALVAASTFAAALALCGRLLTPDRLDQRIASVVKRRTERREASSSSKPAPRNMEVARAYAGWAAARLRHARSSHGDEIRLKTLRAGFHSRLAPTLYVLAKPALAVLAAGLAAGLILGLDIGQLPSHGKPLAILAGAVAGFYAPDLFLANAAKRHQGAISKALPDGLDLLVICAEAGLSLDAALNRVATETAASARELARELATTSAELRFLPERRQALQNLARRCDLAPIRAVVNTLQQTERYGTPLAQSLRVLSSEFREQRMMRAEEKAARLPAIMTVPMIVFILPTLFVVLAGPAMLTVYDNLLQH
jgi:tight adherence protein C